jgi:uncharacterized protein (TIGR03435 family)
MTDMRIATAIAAALAVVRLSAASQSTAVAPRYEVVSIKENKTLAAQTAFDVRPDGSLSLWNVPIGGVISLAYPGHVPVDMVNLPGWAMNERYDVSATSPLSTTTQDQRSAMVRAMLSDRFKLAVRIETRDQPVYDLIVARADKRLGPMIKPSEVDCVAREAAERAAVEAARAAGTAPPPPVARPFDPSKPAAPCTRRRLDNVSEGDYTMATLVQLLRPDAGRLVIDKTGLVGSFRLSLTYASSFARPGSGPGPDITQSPNAPPSVFIAVQDQLGLKLESSKAPRETLIIDRLERPSEN